MKISIGKCGRQDVSIDLDVLLRTRALIQANSGGGKSWLLRRLAEQLYGKVQVFLIDREGEFATLRERYGYVLVGQGGDAAADVRSARPLAEKLLELRASAVFDLYESFRSKPRDRQAWVRAFLEGILDAPKKFWRPLLVIVDEAHLFCPQETPKAASMAEREIISGCKDAMIALATVGRKRGYGTVWATQRLAKVDKDASAELLNRLVGPTIEDVDVDRASDLMSVSRDERGEFRRQLKTLEPGHFFGFGRAISVDRILLKVGSVSTTHPEPGSSRHADEPPPAPHEIRPLLAKLSEFPREAEAKAKTEADLRAEIKALKAQLAAKPAAPSKPSPPAAPIVKDRTVEVPVLSKSQVTELRKLVERVEKAKSHLGFTAQALDIAVREMASGIARSTDIVERLRRPQSVQPKPAAPPARRQADPPRSAASGNGHGEELLAGERKMLEVLAQFHPGTRTRSQLGALSGYTPSGGTFGNYFGRLKRFGLLKEGMLGEILITEEGLAYFGDNLPEAPQSTDELLAMWRSKLLAGERKMLDVVVSKYPESVSKTALGEEAGYEPVGGTFGNYLGTLRRNALVTVDGEEVRASDALFEVGQR